tara:strand:+ start:40 stop:501 length:462 start_codon:yes stop_codon:yes gene_type:complete
MDEDKLVLDLIIADEIEDVQGFPRVDKFSYSFIFDYLSKEDQDRLMQDGVSGSYMIIKKREVREKGEVRTYFAMPMHLSGSGFSRATCPMMEGNFSDDQLHEELRKAISFFDRKFRKQGIGGLVLAAEKSEAEVIKSTFEQLGYEIHEFERAT